MENRTPNEIEIRDQLGRVLASQEFAKAPKAAQLLRYIVESALTHTQANLTESVIAEEVFKHVKFDPATSSVVRTTAANLRRRLAEFYRTTGSHEEIRIEISKWGYHPVFSHNEASATDEFRERRVFLSYAAADREMAQRLSDALRNAGIHAQGPAWELTPGDSIVERVRGFVRSSDLLLVLLSPNSTTSSWVQSELGGALANELKDRAVLLMPVLIADCTIPPNLSDRLYVDLRHDFTEGVQRLVAQLASAPELDFSRLDSFTFEKLVSELLVSLGFSVLGQKSMHSGAFDFLASYRYTDPFGAERTDTWLVEAKVYQDERVSVSALGQIFETLRKSPGATRGLVVTNSRLTSVAREFLSDSIESSGRELRIIDGTELSGLLIRYPNLVQRYFSSGSGHE